MKKARIVRLGRISVGDGKPLVLIAGPCVIESEESTLRHALALKKIAARLRIPFIFKSSYDKANRSSADSFRGLGMEKGLAILDRVKKRLDLPVLTDIHQPEEAFQVAQVVDILQIPAFLSRQTDLLVAAAKTGKIVNVKKGQFMAPEDMHHVAGKIASAGGRQILLTERGTFFGYRALVNDFRSIAIMKDTGWPVIFDATHSVQQPGGLGNRSGGDRRFVPLLAKAAVAAGADGLFMEVHEKPDRAPSDGPNMIPLAQLEGLLKQILRLRAALS